MTDVDADALKDLVRRANLLPYLIYGSPHDLSIQGKISRYYLVSNMDAAEEACRYYQKRFLIETFFSDQKSRGFHIHKSHISDPQRLSRLLIAACLAYLWIVYLGSLCEKEGWGSVIHRSDRCDVSLFQLGLRLLEHFFNEELPMLVQFYVTI